MTNVIDNKRQFKPITPIPHTYFHGILFSGGPDGFIPGCDDIFIGKSDHQDYHKEMNAKHFSEWFLERLLPGGQIKCFQCFQILSTIYLSTV